MFILNLLLAFFVFGNDEIGEPQTYETFTIQENQTENVIAYLSELLEKQVLKDHHLIKLYDDLEKGGFVTPFSEEEVSISSEAYIHSESLQHQIEAYEEINLSRLETWLKETLLKRGIIRNEQKEAEKVVEDPFVLKASQIGLGYFHTCSFFNHQKQNHRKRKHRQNRKSNKYESKTYTKI